MSALKRMGLAFLIAVIVTGLVFSAGCPTPQDEQTFFPPGGMGPGGMMGHGGMMGPGISYQVDGERITIDQATQIAEDFTLERRDLEIEVAEIMEFAYNFYVEFKEENTGIGAFEALIDPFTGIMYPEPGPNMMWNAKYGTMSGMMWGLPSTDAPMTVSEQEAKRLAQEFLDDFLSGTEAEEVERFYGYYTIHVLQDGEIFGMLSVNGYTGQVWYHHWHGEFLRMVEFEH